MNKEGKLLLGFLGALLTFFLIYHGALGNYFSQDDFYFLRLARVESVVGFLNFFNPWHQQGFPAFRPLGTQVPFFLAQRIFHQHAYLFLHFLSFSFHLANFILIYKIIGRLTKKEYLSLALSSLYLIAPLHFLSLFYIAAFQQILAAFWQLFGFYYYLKHYDDNKRYWVYVFFIFALLSKETAIVYPALLFLFSLIIKNEINVGKALRQIKNESFYWLGFVLLIIFYGSLRWLSFSQSPGSAYELSLSVRTLLSSVRWYLIWLLGAPETIIVYAGRGLAFNWPGFVKDAKILGYLFTGTFLAEAAMLCLILIRLTGSGKNRKRMLSLLLWFAIWFVTSLSLVSLFPYHRYSHYLDMSFLALLLVVAEIFRKKDIILWIVLMAIFVLNGYLAVSIDSRLHWAPARSRIAAEYRQIFKDENICRNRRGIYFLDVQPGSAKEVAIALSFADGPRYFCQNYQLPVFYQGVNEPLEKKKGNLLKIESRVRY